MGIKKTVIREKAKNRENKDHSVEELTPQGERLACRYLDQWASSHPSSKSQAPRRQALVLAQRLPPSERLDWRSYGRFLPSQRPRRDRGSTAPSLGA